MPVQVDLSNVLLAEISQFLQSPLANKYSSNLSLCHATDHGFESSLRWPYTAVPAKSSFAGCQPPPLGTCLTRRQPPPSMPLHLSARLPNKNSKVNFLQQPKQCHATRANQHIHRHKIIWFYTPACRHLSKHIPRRNISISYASVDPRAIIRTI